jgi:phytoene dehydrogenase-like protein
MTHDYDLIVVGAGLAGLAAGATATAAGASTVVLDAHQAGGRARTTERGAFTFNMGAHALYLGGAGAAVLRQLGVQPTGAKPPLARYRALRGGQLHVLPTGPSTLMRTNLVGGRGKVQFARLFTQLPRLDPRRLEGRSAEEWVAGWELRADVEALLRALIRLGTYTADLAEFGADAAVSQLQAAGRSGVLYLDGGWAQLVAALERQVEVRTNTAVRAITAGANGVEVTTDRGPLLARSAIIAAGTPAAARTVLPADPGWGELGEPVTAACLDTALAREPSPGYVLSIDEPLYATTQSPPARQAPAGQAVMAVIRCGARHPEEDRADLEEHRRRAGVLDRDIVADRFLARMVVAGTLPRAATGGLRGRPTVTATGLPGVFLAGDWVGPEGLLADAALASGMAAALAATGRRPAPVTMAG